MSHQEDRVFTFVGVCILLLVLLALVAGCFGTRGLDDVAPTGPWGELIIDEKGTIAQVASQEWEQQQIIDHVLHTHMYVPGAWWRLRKRGSPV